MGEPTTMLDVVNAKRIGKLILDLRRDITMALASHNQQETARTADYVALYAITSPLSGPTGKALTSASNP